MRKAVFLLVCLAPASLAQNPARAVLFDGGSSPPWVRLMALTLAGIVNRDSSRLYLQNVYETWSYNQTDERWADLYRSRGNVQFDVITSDTVLVNRFRPFLQGGIRYDYTRTFGNFPGQSFMWQGEYAALIGGLTDRLPLTFGMWNRYRLSLDDSVLVEDPFDGDPPVWVPGKLDTASLPWNSAALTTESDRYLTLLDYGVRVLLPLCNPRSFYIREITDFAVQRKMFQVNLAGTSELKIDSIPPARFDIIERVATYLHAKNPEDIFHIYGWIQPEALTQWLAYFGASFHETLLANLSWHSAFRTAPRAFTRASSVREDTVVLRPKYYLLFQGSEGDASNWVMSFQSGAWFSPRRGAVPVGWGWNLHLLSMMPFVAGYYCDSATANDGFMSVLTPLGFSYPDYWPEEVLAAAVDSSRALMARYAVRDIYGYKHYEGTGEKYYRGKLITDDYLLDRYAQFQRAIGATSTLFFNSTPTPQRPTLSNGVLFLNHKGDGSFYGDVANLGTAAARVIANVKALPKPGFLLAGYQRFRNDDIPDGSRGTEDLTLARLDSLIRLIRADPTVGAEVEVVTPERFSVLMRIAAGALAVEQSSGVPDRFALHQNHPNPFNPSTRISYQLPAPAMVRLAVYDLLGREVALLVQGLREAGNHTLEFDARGLGTGVYLCRIEAAGMTAVRKMLLVK
jgi:hypothetical protein